MRKLANNARMSLKRQRILIVERRIGDFDQAIPRRQIADRSPRQAAVNVAGGVLFDQEAREVSVSHRTVLKVSSRLGDDPASSLSVGPRYRTDKQRQDLRRANS